MKKHYDWIKWVGMIGWAAIMFVAIIEEQPMLIFVYAIVYFIYAGFIYWWWDDMEKREAIEKEVNHAKSI